jgi:hypothetical protein
MADLLAMVCMKGSAPPGSTVWRCTYQPAWLPPMPFCGPWHTVAVMYIEVRMHDQITRDVGVSTALLSHLMGQQLLTSFCVCCSYQSWRRLGCQSVPRTGKHQLDKFTLCFVFHVVVRAGIIRLWHAMNALVCRQ